MIRLPYSYVALILLCFASRLRAVVLDCPEALSALVYEIQRASLGEIPDAVARLQERLGHSPKDHPQGIFAFESDVLSLIETSPKLRAGAVAAFKNKWKLSSDELLDVITYYSIRVFYDEPSLAGDPRSVFSRLQQVSRDHYLSNAENPAARNFAFYQANLTQLSIPEMARQLGISEGAVYQQLAQSGLLVARAFEERPSVHQLRALQEWLKPRGNLLTPHDLEGSVLQISQKLHAAGIPTRDVAVALGIGEQALRFIRHHTEEENRGVAWSRTVSYEGQRQWETSVLVQLHNRGLTHQEIANELNNLFGTPADHSLTRTASAVQAKHSDLGLTTSKAPSGPDIFDPTYGYLKRGGKPNWWETRKFSIL